ncbi:MAG: hypothetical protein KDB18_04920, partial [Salinibacterium sp.]|nr:hypothetical protein [Salinibacterium sp.]
MPKSREPDWVQLKDEELLDLRFKDLKLDLEGTKVEAWFEIVVADLKRRGIRFRPHLWISDEWFTPDGIPGIAVPFYLAHPRLARLESKQILEVEG